MSPDRTTEEPLLRSLGEVEDTLVTVYRVRVQMLEAPAPGEPGFDQIVSASNGDPFASTGHTLKSWLESWLAGADLFGEMFEPGPTRTGINPFTRQPMVIKGQGKPRGGRWP